MFIINIIIYLILHLKGKKMLDKNYAYIKTQDGDEIQGLTIEEFNNAIVKLDYKKLEKSDRVIYFIKKQKKVDNINYFESDYIEQYKDNTNTI